MGVCRAWQINVGEEPTVDCTVNAVDIMDRSTFWAQFIHRSEPMPKALTFELIFLFHFFCSGICERVLMRISPV